MTARRCRIAVVIPCYNGGRFLREAIESVLHQTCRAAELVVVNDGSTDDTAAVARSYEQVRLHRAAQPGRARGGEIRACARAR